MEQRSWVQLSFQEQETAMFDLRHFSPTEREMLKLLMDGHPHRPDELKRVAGDDLMTDGALAVHIHNIRKKLRITGQDVATERPTEPCKYRLLRTTASHGRAPI